MIHLDTHVVLWLAQRDERRLSAGARRLIADEERSISPTVLLELEFLHEIGRLKASPEDALVAIRSRLTVNVSQVPFEDVVNRARRLIWTRDPFDRLIVGAAMAEGVRLVTADGAILDNFRDAVW